MPYHALIGWWWHHCSAIPRREDYCIFSNGMWLEITDYEDDKDNSKDRFKKISRWVICEPLNEIWNSRNLPANKVLNPFQGKVPFLYPWKHQKISGCLKRAQAWNGSKSTIWNYRTINIGLQKNTQYSQKTGHKVSNFNKFVRFTKSRPHCRRFWKYLIFLGQPLLLIAGS